MIGVILMGWVSCTKIFDASDTLGSYLEEDLEKG